MNVRGIERVGKQDVAYNWERGERRSGHQLGKRQKNPATASGQELGTALIIT